MKTTRLFYKNKEFVEKKNIELFEKELASLEINQDTKEAILSFSFEIGLVDKKIAERIAESICKTGFLLENGDRIGIGSELIIK